MGSDLVTKFSALRHQGAIVRVFNSPFLVRNYAKKYPESSGSGFGGFKSSGSGFGSVSGSGGFGGAAQNTQNSNFSGQAFSGFR